MDKANYLKRYLDTGTNKTKVTYQNKVCDKDNLPNLEQNQE